MKKNNYLLILITILMVPMLEGCAYLGNTFGKLTSYFEKKEKREEKEHGKEVKGESERDKIIDKYLKQQLAKGDESFKKRNYKRAKREYLTTYFIDPTNDLALIKLRKIPVVRPKKTTPKKKPTKTPVFTGDHLAYTVKPGDTLAIISQNFYGDYEKYTLLAEVNNIKPPYTLFEGQVIKVPRVAEKIDFDKSLENANVCLEQMDYQCAIKEFSACLSLKPDDEEIKENLKKSYHEDIKMNIDNRSFDEAGNQIEVFTKIAAKSKIDITDLSEYFSKILNNIEALKKEQEKLLVAERLLGEGGELQNNAKMDQAREKYKQALTITEGLEHIDAEEIKEEITGLIREIDQKQLNDKVAILKDEAVKSANNEEYEEGLEKIKKAADLDPENNRVVESREKLNNIVNLIDKAKSIRDKDPQQAFLYYKQAHSSISEEFNHNSSRVEKEMIYTIHKLQKVAENKLNTEDPCGSLSILKMIDGVDGIINIPYFIKNELKAIHLKSSSLKEALDFKCKQ